MAVMFGCLTDLRGVLSPPALWMVGLVNMASPLSYFPHLTYSSEL